MLALVALGVWNPWMLVMVLAVVVMIFLHELGHFIMANAGMKVTEFFLFFGPKLWSFRRGGRVRHPAIPASTT
ncbi:MAG: site-2 protease family protein [Acidimicrobiales bacterium]